MRVGIDIRVLARGTYTGVEEYTRGLLGALIPRDPSVTYRLFYNAFSRAALKEPWTDATNVSVYTASIPNRLLDSTSRLFGVPKIDKLIGGVDIFLSPHFLLTSLSSSIPRVLVIHDLSFHFHPNFFSLRRRMWHASMQPERQVRDAARLIAVSHATAQDLEYSYRVPRERIEVVLSGLSLSKSREAPLHDERHLEAMRRKYRLPKTFFLYFGTIEPRKNLIGVVRAFERARTRLPHKGWKLVIAGSLGWSYKPILKAIEQSPARQDILLTGFVKKEDKSFLYRLSSCFLYPSFFEGFGFPPLEAMQCGVPTITSNTTSLPEVVGDAAILVDPYRIDEIASAMEMVASDERLRSMLRERGMRQAQKFSWDSAAERVLQILREVSQT